MRINVNKNKYSLDPNNKFYLNKNFNLKKVDLGKNYINCFNKNGNNNLLIINKKVFLNNVNETNKFGLNLGDYVLKNKNTGYPIGFVCSSDIINVTSGTYEGSEVVENINVNFYSGNIEFSVLKKFNFISLYFYNVGYLDCINKIAFTNLCGNVDCSCDYFQSYNVPYTAVEVRACVLSNLWKKVLCQNANNAKLRKIINQQNLYTLMRRKPELFPIISSVKNLNLPLNYQRRYSNMWYRQFGTSQALPVNDNFGGFFCPGSETPFTN